MVRKAVLPVAGLGTRFLPVTKAVPKELLPLVDRPCFAYVIAEAVEAGIEEIILVTARGKSSLEDYFDRSPALEAQLEAAGKREMLAEILAISRSAKVISIRQHEPKGLGHAVLTAAPAVGKEDFAVLLPDDIVDAKEPVIGQLMRVHAETGGIVVSLKDVPRALTNRYGICAGPLLRPGLMRVEEMVEKPAPEVAPSTASIVGRYLLPASIFEVLAQTPPGRGGEIQLTDAMAQYCRKGQVHGWHFSGSHFDTGNPVGLLDASIHYALRRPNMEADVRALLKRYS